MKKVLVVDDSPDCALTLQEMFRWRGLSCDICFSGEEAEVQLSHKDYDLIVTDVIMGSVNGLDLIANARKSRFSGYIIAMSGGGPTLNAETALEASAFHVNAVLKKPFYEEDLFPVLEKMIMEDKMREKNVPNEQWSE